MGDRPLTNCLGRFPGNGAKNTNISAHDAWLKAHAFFVTAISGAIYIEGGDCRRLSDNESTLRLMVAGVHEGFAVVRASGLPVTPLALKVLFTWLPQSFAVLYWRRFFASEMADYVFGRHARDACAEMREVASDCRTLLKARRVEAPALRQLYAAIDRFTEQYAARVTE